MVGCNNRECIWLTASQVEVLTEGESTNRNGCFNKMLNISMGHKIPAGWKWEQRYKECLKYCIKVKEWMDYNNSRIVLVAIINTCCHSKQIFKFSLTSITKSNFSGKKSLKCISEDFTLSSDWWVLDSHLLHTVTLSLQYMASKVT